MGRVKFELKDVVKKIYESRLERGVQVQKYVADELECGHTYYHKVGGKLMLGGASARAMSRHCTACAINCDVPGCKVANQHAHCNECGDINHGAAFCKNLD